MVKKVVFWGSCILLLLVCVLAYVLYPRQQKESPYFEEQITPIASQAPHLAKRLTKEKEEYVASILSQPFFFLDRGKQSSAFVSKDDQYVIKFLRKKPLVIQEQYENLPDIYPFTILKERLARQREKRKQNLFDSLLLSYEMIPEETGLVFVHLASSKPFKKNLFLLDASFNPHYLEVDTVQWFLQKKAQMIKPVLAELMWQGDENQAKRRIDQIFELLLACSKKGVVDADPNLIKNDNIGFTEERAIYIDIGKLRKKHVTKAEFAKSLDRLKLLSRWLREYYPELADYFDKKKKATIDSYL
jgi:hypothetical protein